MKNNPFEAHGIKALSPTQINKFRRSPARWLTNVAGFKDRLFKPAFTYGNAIEQGITHAVMVDSSFNECVEKAMNEFDFIEFGIADIVRSDFVKNYLTCKHSLEATSP